MEKDVVIAQTGDLSDAAMGRRARAVRLALEAVSQTALAERLGIAVGAVKAWESQTRGGGIRAKHIRVLSDMAGIRSDFIIAGDLSELTIRREFWLKVRAHLLDDGAADPS